MCVSPRELNGSGNPILNVVTRGVSKRGLAGVLHYTDALRRPSEKLLVIVRPLPKISKKSRLKPEVDSK